MKKGTFIIVNDVDCPMLDLVAVVTSPGRAMYISKRLEHFELMHLGEYATPVSDFGINLEFEGDHVTSHQCDVSDATYPDGRPRKWQDFANPKTVLLSQKAQRKIETLAHGGFV